MASGWYAAIFVTQLHRLYDWGVDPMRDNGGIHVLGVHGRATSTPLEIQKLLFVIKISFR